MPVHSNKHCTQTTLTTTQQLHTVQPLYQPLYLPISQTHDPQNQILKTYNLQRTHVLLQNTTINQLSITHYQDFYIQHSTTASSNTSHTTETLCIKTPTNNIQMVIVIIDISVLWLCFTYLFTHINYSIIYHKSLE